MGESIEERSHQAIRAYLRHRNIEVLEETGLTARTTSASSPWTTRSSSSWTPPPSAEAYLTESEVEGLTSIRYYIVSLLVTGSEKALLRHHKNVLNDGR